MRSLLLAIGTQVLALASLHAHRSPQPSAGESVNLDLTNAEIQWLKDHPKIKLGFDPEWPPFSFYNSNGEAEGLDIDYLAIIGERLGITFETTRWRNWDETNEHLKLGEIDLVSGIHPTDERKRILLFTESYADFPTAIITRLDGPFFTSIPQMKDHHIASPRSYVTTTQLKSGHPQLFLTETDTLLNALQMVSQGKADFSMANLASASFLIRENGLGNLKIAGMTGSGNSLHFGIRRDLPLLHSSVEKALASIQTKDRTKLLADWVYIPRESPNAMRRYAKWIIAGTALTALVLAALCLHNRRLRTELIERRRIEAELRRLNEEKSQFMSMAAHDIGNPLAAIKIDCQTAISRQQKTPGGESSGYQHILKHAQRISNLISSLLDNQPQDPGKIPFQPRSINLVETVNKVVDSYSLIATRKGIHITHMAPEDPDLRIWADPNPVMQVLENLISNAVKFSPPSGTVTVTSSLADDRARVEVRDHGPGITEEDRPHLFGWFARLSAQPTGEESSHGLGLFIVKELMDEMNGKVWVESTPGDGANFIIEFGTRPAPDDLT
ncbi:MAG: ATP-binding protein [Verrucomicrobiales bacterium]|nr:transporter substrate-binding domain-containing protein [Verrucomicrobiota bacterium JB025]